MSGQLEVVAAGLSDTGLVRSNNEDRVFVIDRREANSFGADSYGVYLVADGLGGHQGGEVASEMAMRTISALLLSGLTRLSAADSPSHLLEGAIQNAHHKILELAASRPELQGMGTTVTVGLRLDLNLYVGHVGDSRAYLARDRRLIQLTEDHSVVALLLRQGTITPQEAISHPDRGKILRCLGVTENVTVDTALSGIDALQGKLVLRRDDALVFCSDGLHGYISDAAILDCLSRWADPPEACRRLVDLANSAGGADNTSVIVVRVT